MLPALRNQPEPIPRHLLPARDWRAQVRRYVNEWKLGIEAEVASYLRECAGQEEED